MAKAYEVIDCDIEVSRKLLVKKKYIITTKVHVKKNVTLTVEDGTTIFILNGLVPDSKLRRAALIFDQGSALRAKRLSVKACDNCFRSERRADNGGLWFIGNFQNARKDNIQTKVRRASPVSSFKALSLTTQYLGRTDPSGAKRHQSRVKDDIDGLSILGVGPCEWVIPHIASHYSADDGIDITNSHIRIDKLTIKSPTEDGVNLSSSHLEVFRSLHLDVRKTDLTDRDLVDFETDDGASFLQMHANCKLDLHGVFGDQVHLISKEMPPPNTDNDNESTYRFKGTLKRRALIYSTDED